MRLTIAYSKIKKRNLVSINNDTYQKEKPYQSPGGYLVQKTLRGCAANMGSKISLLIYEWPLINCKIWYMNGSIFQNLTKFEPKIGSNIRKFWKKMVILFKIWPKIGPIGIWMGYLFLKKWYLYGSTFKFCGGTSLPKPNLSTPPIRATNSTTLIMFYRFQLNSNLAMHYDLFWNELCHLHESYFPPAPVFSLSKQITRIYYN